ncbi:putative chromatin assembly factor 1 subunit C [Babesia divergens]|uniref:Chromatin assembly factor 1 subunit C n=1 Tax=Babesia divergens TaxID=32595 RepID=A0AAD9GG76_BABDI|nr:putative chromatin assembly factor 1 subunit C [Babesia divergens]
MEEERHNWLVNTRVLYNFISCIRLPHQPLAVEFLPTMSWRREAVEGVAFQYLACGLQAEPGENVSLYVIEVAMPTEPIKEELRRYSQCVDYEGFPLENYREPMYQCVSKGELSGDINRVRSHAYEGKGFLAAKSTDVYVYDIERGIKEDEDLKPIFTFSDHEKEGYGLAFHKNNPTLGSCSDDGLVNVWELNEGKLVYNFQYPEGLNCMEFLGEENRAVVAAEDGRVLIVDMRQPDVAGKTANVDGAINAISCHRLNHDIFATGSTSGVVHIWDYRKLDQPVHEIKAHDGSIVRLHFNDSYPNLFASASDDSTVRVFDLDEVDSEPDDMDEDEGDSANELVFTHTGHQEQVYDFCWSADGSMDTFVASVGEDYCLQLWQMTDDILNYSSDDDDENTDNI